MAFLSDQVKKHLSVFLIVYRETLWPWSKVNKTLRDVAKVVNTRSWRSQLSGLPSVLTNYSVKDYMVHN